MFDSAIITSLLLVAVLAAGACYDARFRRLPNWLTLGAAALGLALNLALRGLPGAGDSLLGWLVGSLLLFLPFALGGMGAGDVKFLAAVGALKGASFVFFTFIYMGLIGGAVALFIVARRQSLGALLRRAFASLRFAVTYFARFRALPPATALLPRPAFGEAGTATGAGRAAGAKAGGFPYGLAIAAGGMLALALGH